VVPDHRRPLPEHRALGYPRRPALLLGHVAGGTTEGLRVSAVGSRARPPAPASGAGDAAGGRQPAPASDIFALRAGGTASVFQNSPDQVHTG
jgi:hypothetical protein